MKRLKNYSILEYSPDDFQSIRKLYGLDNSEILNESLNALQDWANKQSHFIKKDFEKKHLEWALITSKGSLERAKERLDKYCSARIFFKKMYEELDLKTNFEVFHTFHAAILPKYTGTFYRVGIFKQLEVPEDWNAILNSLRYFVIAGEYLRAHDYLNGIVVVIDFSAINVRELINLLNLSDSRQFISVIVDCCGIPLKEIHIITPSAVVEMFINLLSPLLGAKLRKRFKIHKTCETLYDDISQDVLPVEYGGGERSLAELDKEWLLTLSSKENIEYLKKAQEYRTEESNRKNVDDFNERYLGTPGSFRRLVID